MLGPKSMPQAARDKIAKDIAEIGKEPDVVEKLTAGGNVVNPGTPKDFADALADQRKTVKRIGDTLGIKPSQ